MYLRQRQTENWDFSSKLRTTNTRRFGNGACIRLQIRIRKIPVNWPASHDLILGSKTPNSISQNLGFFDLQFGVPIFLNIFKKKKKKKKKKKMCVCVCGGWREVEWEA